jgi:hypothetical protein
LKFLEKKRFRANQKKKDNLVSIIFDEKTTTKKIQVQFFFKNPLL